MYCCSFSTRSRSITGSLRHAEYMYSAKLHVEESLSLGAMAVVVARAKVSKSYAATHNCLGLPAPNFEDFFHLSYITGKSSELFIRTPM